jgi:hypothetical protein
MVWTKPAFSDQEFFQDRGQCQAQAFSVPNPGAFQVAAVFNACMNGKGYYKVSAVPTAASTSTPGPREDYRECADEAERRSGTKDIFDPQSKAAYSACMQSRGHKD